MAETQKSYGILEAMFAVQKEITSIKKDSKNPHFGQKYASLHAIMTELQPHLTKNNLLLIHYPSFQVELGIVNVETKIIHVPSNESKTVNLSATSTGDAQKIGSAITYLRRYGISSLLALVTEDDDDGNVASSEKEKNGNGQDRQKDHKEEGMRKTIGEICMTISGGDTEQAPSVLEELSEWKVDGEVKRKGVKSVKDLDRFSGKVLGAIYANAKEALSSWEKVHGTDNQEGNGIGKVEGKEKDAGEPDDLEQLKITIREIGVALGHSSQKISAVLRTDDVEKLKQTKKVWYKELNEMENKTASEGDLNSDNENGYKDGDIPF